MGNAISDGAHSPSPGMEVGGGGGRLVGVGMRERRGWEDREGDQLGDGYCDGVGRK